MAGGRRSTKANAQRNRNRHDLKPEPVPNRKLGNPSAAARGAAAEGFPSFRFGTGSGLRSCLLRLRCAFAFVLLRPPAIDEGMAETPRASVGRLPQPDCS